MLEADYTQIKDFKDVVYKKQAELEINPVTQTLCLLGMNVRLQTIDDKNKAEWLYRIGVLEKIFGQFLSNDDGTPHYFTEKDLEDHKGLRLNVPNETRRGFNARMAKGVLEAVQSRPMSKAYDCISTIRLNLKDRPWSIETLAKVLKTLENYDFGPK